MQPAFRSTRSIFAFCFLIAFLLALPVILSWIGLPSREQAFSSMSDHVGPVGAQVETLYHDPQDADVLFVGSSLVRVDIKTDRIEKALSAHLGRPAHVTMLAMTWPGIDYQYFMLRDYLNKHKATLIVWNLPQKNGYHDFPHLQSYRWIRYGEYDDAFQGLPMIYRIYLYGEMVLGAPRELLAKVRPNLIGDDEKTFEANDRWAGTDPLRRVGYNGAPFVPEAPPPSIPGETFLQPLTSPGLTVTGPKPKVYQDHFLHKFFDLAQQHGSQIVFLHIPQAFDYGNTSLHELTSWSQMFGPDHQIIGAPERVLFPGLNRQRYLHFFVDENHMNYNGEVWFTDKITASVIKAYDEATQRQPSEPPNVPAAE